MDEFCTADCVCAEDWGPDDEEIEGLSAEALRSRLRCLERRLARRPEPSPSVSGILDAVDAAVVVLGPGQRIMEANEQIRSWLPGQAFIGRSFSDVLTGAVCRNRLVSRVADCLNGQPFELEIRAELPVGRRWLHISGRPFGGGESGPGKAVLTLRDVTRRRRLSKRHGITGRVLRRLNRSGEVSGMIRDILREIKSGFDMEAAALRLRKGEDFPYHESEGFSGDFIREESYLCRRDGDGEILRDPEGRALLACMCGSVISGHFDSRRDWFTRGGSFWSRDLCGVVTEIAGTPLAEATRQRCHLEGYRTAALVPVKTGDAIIGLLQLADPQPDKLSEADIAFLEQLGNSIGVAVARVADEERVREKEADLYRAQAVARCGSWRFDLDSRLVEASPEARRIYGLAKETLSIPEVQKIPLPAFRPLLNGALEKLVKEGVPYDLTFQIRRPTDGKVLDIHSVAEYDAGRNMVVGVIRDITEQRRAPKALRESEDRYRSLVENAADAIFVAAPDTGEIIELNRKAEELLGRPRAEIAGMHQTELHPPESLEFVVQEFRRASREDGARRIVETEILRKDGRRVPVEINSGGVVQSGDRRLHLGLFRDISERKAAEAALRESEHRFRSLAETLPIGVLEVDSGGSIQYANPAFFRTFGFPPDRVIGRSAWEFMADRDGFRERFFRFQVDRRTPRPAFFRAADNAGNPREVRMDWDYRRDESGTPTGYIGVVTDVTERQRLENQLRQAQKLEGIGQLAGGVAHDFNNMLSPIIGYAEMLKDDLSADDPRTEDVDEILRAAVRSRNLVRKLLAFARKQALEMKPVRLNRIVREMEPMLRRNLGDAVSLAFFLDARPDTIRGDAGQIQQVLLNLAVNARDAMPGGGKLTVETQTVSLDEAYCSQHAGAEPGAYLMLSVSDTGTGMDPELQARVFEPFFTTKPTGQGTGMGLATAYGIVKQHRGNIWVYSEPGQGATFKVYLPQAACGGETRCSPETEAAAGEEKTVLLVEDEAAVRQLVRHALERRGYIVLEMESPAACLDFLEGYNAPIDLLLTDVVMPGMNGRELYREIAQTRPDLPVLFMSGYTENVISRHGVLDSGVALLQKPFSVKELARKVREVLER